MGLTQSVRSADIYVRLCKVAEQRPAKALETWLSGVTLDRSRSPTVLAIHQRGLRRLIALARGAVGDGKVAKLEELIRQAEDRLAHAVVAINKGGAAEPELVLTLSPPGKVAVMATTRTPTEPACPPDLMRLQEVAARWPCERWIRWLADGFRVLQDGGGRPHLAFAPIRLYPVGRYLEQFEASIAEASEHRLGIAGALHKSISVYLATGYPALREGSRFDPLFWRIYAQGHLGDPSGAVPSGYLSWSRRSPGASPNDAELVDAISQAIFETVPGRTTVAALFEQLTEEFDSANADAALVVALLNEAQIDIGLSDEPVPDAAEKCRALLARRPAEITPVLDRLLAGGRLDGHGMQAFNVAVETAPQLILSIRREALRRLPRPDEPLLQPPPIPLDQTPFFELAG